MIMLYKYLPRLPIVQCAHQNNETFSNKINYAIKRVS